MKSLFLNTFLLLSINSLSGQAGNNFIEISPYFRWDWYPKFTYSINPVNSNTVRIIGKSVGINISYKTSLPNKIFVKTGLGYYKYSFNKMDEVNSLFSESHHNNRIIEDYTPPGNSTPLLVFVTDKYWYNCIAVNTGFEKHIEFKKNWTMIVEVGIVNYYTFSQNYHITYPSPNGDNYKLTNSRYFGIGTKINIGLQKKLKKIELGPMITLPVYDKWKQDKVFPQEDNSMSRNKWVKGFGIGLSCNYPLSRK